MNTLLGDSGDSRNDCEVELQLHTALSQYLLVNLLVFIFTFKYRFGLINIPVVKQGINNLIHLK